MDLRHLRGAALAAAAIRRFFPRTLVLFLCVFAAAAATDPHHALAQLQMPFVANLGQQPADVAFSASMPWGAAFVGRAGEIAYLVAGKDAQSPPRFLREQWVGGAPATVHGEQPLATRVNFLKGRGPATNAPAFERVSLGQRYPGIEIKLQASANNIEKLFYLEPHADPALIRIRPLGVTALRITPRGELVLNTERGPVTFTKPVAYQESDKGRTYVDVGYEVVGRDYGFRLAAYDKRKALVIDPVLASASVGGSGLDSASGMAIDANGNIYLSGNTYSVDLYATAGVFDPTFSAPYAGTDGFVARLNADLSAVTALTYLGGSSYGSASAIALDSTGAVVVAGSTGSATFTTASTGYQRTLGGKSDAFVLKLSADLTTLLGGTFLGGSGNDAAYALLVDADDNVYVGGGTFSSNFPLTAGAMDSSYGGGYKYINRYKSYSWGDGFLAKFDGGLTTLLAATYIGGAKGDESVRRLARDSLGNLLVLGLTGSSDFPATAGAYDTSYNGGASLLYGRPWGDAFVAKLDASLSSMTASTLLGGSAIEYAWALALDAQDNVYVGGETYSSNFPATPGVFDTGGPSNTTYAEGFISKLNPGLSTLLASGFIGGGYSDVVGALAIDSAGNVHVAGNTRSSDFPKTAGTAQGGMDSFVARASSDLATLFESELIGVSGDDSLGQIAFGPDGAVYATGYTATTVSGSTVSNVRVVKLGAVDLSVMLEDNPDPATTGSVLTYTLRIANSGVIAATGVTAVQTLPDHASFVSATPDQGDCTYAPGNGGLGGTVTCALGTVAGNANAAVSVVVVPTDSGAYSSTATVSSVEGDSNLANNSATAITTVGATPGSVDLSIGMTDSPDPVSTGAALTYAITVTNNSTGAATGVTVTDTLPAGVSFASASASQGACTESAGTVSCALGALGGNAAASVSIVVTPNTAGTLTNNASVSATEADPNAVNNSASATTSAVVLSDLSVAQSASPNPVDAGAPLTYTITVTNGGPGAASAVVLSDSLPGAVSFVSATPTQGSCSHSAGVVTCVMGALANGASATVAVVVTPTTPGVTLSNTVTVSGAESDTNSGNNAATSSVTVNGSGGTPVDVAVEFLLDNPDPVTVGQPLGYTGRITNYNSGAPVNVVIEDVLPAGVTFVGANLDGAPCAFSGGVVRCEGPVSVTPSYVSINVVPNVPGTIANTLTATPASPDFNPENNSLTISTSVIADTTSADVSVSLAGPADGNLGVPMTYVATVANAGPGNATLVKLTDVLEADMSFSSATASQGSCAFSAGTVTCELGTIAVGATASVSITVVPTGDGGFTHTVAVSSSKSDPNTKNNTASLETEVR